jgi:1-acyl-sn-glycerol-3-phosphate acyltransferase
MAWADIWFALIFIRHRNVYMEGEQKGQPFIYISNHISYLDSAVIPKIFRHPVRPLGKVEMARIPIFGFIYKNVIVTVDRSSSANRSRSVQILKSVLKKGISVLVFPEGTFNTTQEPLKEFYEGAFRIAIETQTPIRPVLLLNTYDRMHYSSLFSLNPGRSVALFLPPIPVEGLTVQDAGDLKKTAFQVMQKALVDNKVSWITMNPANVLNS